MASADQETSTAGDEPVGAKQHVCAQCGNPATQICSGCNETPGHEEHGNTYYCSIACQKTARPDHEKLCLKLQQRRALYRAGDIAQSIFYAFREKVFDNQVVKIQHADKKMIVHLSLKWPLGVNPFHIVFCPFPSSTTVAESDKNAVLAVHACDDALGYMHGTYQSLLSRKCPVQFSHP